ncbi:hypothetical protein GDO86_019146 [Hymenochirus boettgeri]|uniref:SH2 domain-containing protein n=1 Tax=Hymenochirus boettgeri TaxID=247094 RepID=A0A8T2I9L1_9PIPI|nr:hypothetical protein GDO86_019146 [Hymenochirus boettgeri]
MPKNYIAKVCNRWLFKGVNREKAEEMLLVNCNCSGSFLIRESETRRGSYTLSVRRTNQNVRDSIKHYRINCLDNGWFYISPRLTFASLQDMVNYYSEIADGICCILKDPCIVQMVSSTITHRTTEPAIVTNPTFNWKEVDSFLFRSTLLKEDTSCPLSLGLREAVSSYMFLTQESDLEKDDWWNTC